jgi:hypothetical protein
LALQKARHDAPLPPPTPSTAIDRVKYGHGEEKCESTLAVASAKKSLPSVSDTFDPNALMVEAARRMSS